MSKEELIELKRKLEKKYTAENLFTGGEEYSLYEIETGIATEDAVLSVEKYLEELVKYYVKQGVEYDIMTLVSTISLLFEEGSFDAVGNLKEGKKPLSNIAVVEISGLAYSNGGKDFADDFDAIFPNKKERYIVEYDKFLALLRSRGFVFTGLESTDDIFADFVNPNPRIDNRVVNPYIAVCFKDLEDKTNKQYFKR